MNIQKTVTSFLKKHRNFIFFLVLAFAGVLSTLYVEYRFQYEQFRWLATRIFFASFAIVLYGGLPKKFRKEQRRKVNFILISFVFLYVLNLLANLINVYHLDEYQAVRDFCTSSPKTCQTIVNTFFKLKLYRFVSLTSYFFSYVIFFLIGLLFSEEIYKKAADLLKNLPRVKLEYAWLFYLLLIYLVFQQLIFVFSTISKRVISVFGTLDTPYEQRWEATMGGRYSFGWMWTYMEFINNHTAENTIILIPDQAAPWEMEGNPFYTRWFIYPRRMVQLDENREIPTEADIALITYGIFGHNKEVFPTITIPEENIAEIVLIDRSTLEVTTIMDAGFDPEDYQDDWGFIRFRKK